ncbi:hypothetical protein ACIQOW_28980 [Kitasatospora sp. NPDC091335]|uniref:hypothetical protein n=1 Tax=Kitasatospora sp. NPDC091335 TaxID=3364085 RepID=UPI003804C9AA
MTTNQKLFRQGLLATTSTVTVLATTTAQATQAAQAAPGRRDEGPHRYKVSVRAAHGAWTLPSGLTSFTVYARGSGGTGGPASAAR